MGDPAKKAPVPDDDLTLEEIERLEDRADARAAQEAIDEMIRTGEKPIAWHDVKRRIDFLPELLVPNHAITFSPRAQRQLAALERSSSYRIAARVEALAHDPWLPGCRRLVATERRWRVRVGDFRIVYDVEGDVLIVLIVDIVYRQ